MMYTEYKFNWHYFQAAPWAAGMPTPLSFLIYLNLTFYYS